MSNFKILDVLAPELLHEIVSFLPLQSLLIIRGVCTTFHDIVLNSTRISRPRASLLRLFIAVVNSPAFIPTREWTLANPNPFDRIAYIESLEGSSTDRVILPPEFTTWVMEWPGRASFGSAWPGLPAHDYAGPAVDGVQRLEGKNWLGSHPPQVSALAWRNETPEVGWAPGILVWKRDRAATWLICRCQCGREDCGRCSQDIRGDGSDGDESDDATEADGMNPWFGKVVALPKRILGYNQLESATTSRSDVVFDSWCSYLQEMWNEIERNYERCIEPLEVYVEVFSSKWSLYTHPDIGLFYDPGRLEIPAPPWHARNMPENLSNLFSFMASITPRRSARVRNQPSRTAPSAAQVDDDSASVPNSDEGVDAEEQEDYEAEELEEPEKTTKKRKAPQAKKRNASVKKTAGSASNTGQPPAKKARVRGTRGVLKQIMEMPFDILYEIFIRLEPMDLINLGRTSKDLKDLVMSNDCKLIWTHALAATGLPPCPEDMSLPAYADLAFGKNCWKCSNAAAVSLLWEDRKKLCDNCWTKERRVGISAAQIELLPVSVRRQQVFSSFRNASASGYFGRVILRLIDEYRSLNTEDEKLEWEKGTLQHLQALSRHVSDCRGWRTSWKRELERQEEMQFQSRIKKVGQMIKDLGWEAELASMRQWDLPQNREDIRKICRKEFNDRIIENLKGMLHDIMAQAKRDRIDRENESKLITRLDIAVNAYNEAIVLWGSPFESHPRACDIMVVPRIRELISDIENKPNLTEADFQFKKDTLPGIIKEAQAIIDNKVLDIVANGFGRSKTYNPATVLTLATTLFNNQDLESNGNLPPRQRSQAKVSSFLTVPEVMTCASAAAGNHKKHVYETCVSRACPSSYFPWDGSSTIKFNKPAHKAACSVLKICKLDPKETTLEEVEQANPILECESCNTLAEGRLMLSWDGAVAHALEAHKGGVDSKTMRLIQGKEADKVRDVIDVNKRRRRYANRDTEAVCLHCNDGAVNSVKMMLNHINEAHGVKFAGDEDMAFAMVKGGVQGTAGAGAGPSESNKRKRKAPEKSKEDDTNEKAAKKSKTRIKQKGSLTKVLDMPFDILLEIFGHFLPADLLSLGRVSQEFRQLVMSAEFKSIWVQCRAQIPNSPECPQDITEPMFAELAFGKGCLMCKKNGTNIHTLWQARTRLCTNCISDTFVSAAFIKRLKLPQDIHNMVPSIFVKNKTHYSPKHAKTWAAEYQALKTDAEKGEWEKTKKQYLSSHASACENWVVKAKQFIEDEKIRDVTKQKQKLLRIANAMGWADEISRLKDKCLPHHSDLDKICQKDFTDESIEKAKTIINDMMQNIQDRRVEEEKKELFRSRMELLQTAYNKAVKDWLSTNSAPYISDFFIVPHIRSVIVDTAPEITVTRKHFFDEDTFSGLVDEARAIRREKCFKVIADGYRKLELEYNPSTVLSLATTVFGIAIKGVPEHRSMTIANIISWKSNPTLQSNRDRLPLVEKVALEVFSYSPWNAEDQIIFDWIAHSIISNLMKLCGADPLTTTLKQLNSLDPIFECIPCNRMHRGRPMMRWTEAAWHVKSIHYKHTNSSVSFMEIPESVNLESVRKGIKEAEERKAYANNTDAKCKHCDVVGKTVWALLRLAFEDLDSQIICVVVVVHVRMVKGGAQETAAGPSASNKGKRKAPITKEADTNEKAVKKPKTRAKQKASLTKVLDMPFDILLEIFGHLLPADLLNLGRVSQEFRQLVMSAEFKSIWVQCRTRLPDSPECPQDITEPMFAELAFGKGCMVGISSMCAFQLLKAVYFTDVFVSAPYIRRLKLPQDIHNRVPAIYVKHKTHYCARYAQTWADEYHALKTDVEKAEWEKTKLQYLSSVAEHARACEDWVIKAKEFIENEKNRDVTERKGKLLEMANKMGWAEEISRLKDNCLPHHIDLDKICQKEFTDASLETAKAIINDMMQSIQNRRLEEEKRVLFISRMDFLQTVYNQAVKDWFPTNYAPFISDFFVVPHIRSVVVDTDPEITVTREHFFDENTFHGLVEEARAIRREKCLELIAKGYEAQTTKADYDPNTVFDLATTVFGYVKDGLPDNRIHMNVEQALSIKSSPALASTRLALPLVERVALQVFKYSPWNTQNRIIFHWIAHGIISNLMKLCGVDPLTTTLEQMNTLDPIFECIPCNRMSRGRLMMRWVNAVSHVQTTHYEYTYSSVSFLEIPGVEDLARVRTAIKEAEDRAAYSDNINATCKHCKIVGNLRRMRRHLLDKWVLS
ncbi:hypothetical protein CVT24_001375 [Panaeolus cyanescens]|uniref:F-box domain-containing protein n=1 Tax=Panaeolus cyanescens TaxID=181874 RepID=A0A409VTH4_9AGAR|nr:hypothetical protein CVT24_001375 [Panaeolus cyanescens]